MLCVSCLNRRISVGKAQLEFKSFPKQGKNLLSGVCSEAYMLSGVFAVKLHFVSFAVVLVNFVCLFSQFSLYLHIASLHTLGSFYSVSLTGVSPIDTLEDRSGVGPSRVISLSTDKAMCMHLKVLCSSDLAPNK